MKGNIMGKSYYIGVTDFDTGPRSELFYLPVNTLSLTILIIIIAFVSNINVDVVLV